MATGRPRQTAESSYTDKAFVGTPSGQGAHNWQPMAFSPQTGLAYIPAQEVPMVYEAENPFVAREGGWNLGINLAANKLPDGPAELKAIRASLKGHLAAWDPVTQKEVWRVQQGGPWNGGVLTSAGGLVFQGTSSGQVVAYAADTGRKLWSFDAGIGIMAPPITYAVNGRQYVAVMAGYGGGYGISTAVADMAGPRPMGRLFVFALDAKAPYKFERIAPAPAVVVAGNWSPAVVAHGGQIFESTCAVCHGATARSSGVVPDLRRSSVTADKDAWHEVVINGALTSNGMISFKRWLTPADSEAVRAYIAVRAKVLKEQGT